MSLATISARTIQRLVSVSFILATLVVITLTLIPLNGSGPKIPYLDKIIHFFMFGGWSFLFGWVLTITYHAYRKKRRDSAHESAEGQPVQTPKNKSLISVTDSAFLNDFSTPFYLIALSGFIFGGIIEILQGILPVGRTPDLADTLANGLGSLFAAFFLRWISTKSFYRKSVEVED